MSFGGSDSSNNSQQQQSQAQSFANSSTGNQAGQYANGPINSAQLQGALNQAQALYQNGNALTNAGFANVNNAANAGTALFGQGNQQLADTLNGTYLSAGNPAFQSMLSQINQGLQPQIAGAFEGAGRYGSGAYANAYANALANAVAPLAFQNYSTERGNQLAAAQSLPSYTSGLTNPGQAQVTAGYTPINQFISQLSQLQPGTAGSYGQASNNANNGTAVANSSGIGQGSASNFGVNTAAKK